MKSIAGALVLVTGAVGAEQIVRGDLTDAAVLRRAVDGCDEVVHCAAEVSDDLDRCRAANVDGVRVLGWTPIRKRDAFLDGPGRSGATPAI